MIHSYESLTAVALVLSTVALFSYFNADVALAAFHKKQTKARRRLWKWVTFFGYSTVYIVPAVIVWAVFRNIRPELARGAVFVLVTVGGSGLIADVLKGFFGRHRPTNYFSHGKFGFTFFKHKYTMISFPSGHSATALSAALTFALFFPAWEWVLLAAGMLVAYSRTALAKHYFSDVLMGSLLGIATVVIANLSYFHY